MVIMCLSLLFFSQLRFSCNGTIGGLSTKSAALTNAAPYIGRRKKLCVPLLPI